MGREEQGDALRPLDSFTFADPDMEDGDAAPRAAARKRGTDLPLTLDASGGARATIKNVERSDQPRDLVAELEYRDPNGETLTAATRVALWPATHRARHQAGQLGREQGAAEVHGGRRST